MSIQEQKALWKVIDARDKALLIMRREIKAKDAALQEKESTIKEQDRLIQENDSVVQEKEKALRLNERSLEEKEEALKVNERSLKEKERVIGAQNRELRFYHIVCWPLYAMTKLVHSMIGPTRRLVKNLRSRIARINKYLPGQENFIVSSIFKMAGSIKRISELFHPRLGNLNQYSPRPLDFSTSNRQVKKLSQEPTFSIVTPSFEQGAYIERTIRSVLNQEYPNLEYFIQDGGSKDNTKEILKKYENELAGWTAEMDAGQSQAINLGFARTSGEIMAWLNSDDLLMPGALNYIADFFNRNPEVDVVYGNRLLINEDDMEIGRWIMPGHNSDVLTWVDYVPQETMFWRRHIWDKVGGIDESFRFAMDWDLLIRFRDSGAVFAHVPRFLGAFRVHDQQKTSVEINEIGIKEMCRIREAQLGRVPGHEEIRKAVFPYLLKHVVVDSIHGVKKTFWRRS